MSAPAQPGDQLCLAAVAVARRVRSNREATLVSINEIIELCRALLLARDALAAMVEALAACRDTDRSAPYQPGEALPDGQRPADLGGAAGDKFQTPREIATALIGNDAT